MAPWGYIRGGRLLPWGGDCRVVVPGTGVCLGLRTDFRGEGGADVARAAATLGKTQTPVPWMPTLQSLIRKLRSHPCEPRWAYSSRRSGPACVVPRLECLVGRGGCAQPMRPP